MSIWIGSLLYYFPMLDLEKDEIRSYEFYLVLLHTRTLVICQKFSDADDIRCYKSL